MRTLESGTVRFGVFGTARLWDDGIIEPADTREILALALDLARFSPLARPLNADGYGVFRM